MKSKVNPAKTKVVTTVIEPKTLTLTLSEFEAGVLLSIAGKIDSGVKPNHAGYAKHRLFTTELYETCGNFLSVRGDQALGMDRLAEFRKVDTLFSGQLNARNND